MTALDEAWERWRGLSERGREEFLHLLRENYAERRRRENGSHRLPMPTSLADLTLTDQDLAI